MKTELLNLTQPDCPSLVVQSRSRPKQQVLGTGTHRFTGSLRVPVRKDNRDYLRALRAAEMAAWENAGTSSDVESKVKAFENDGSGLELGAFAVLAACAGFVVAYSMWVGTRFAVTL